MSKLRDVVECRTPTAGKKSTRIDRWKFDAVRRAILNVLPKTGGLLFSGLSNCVEAKLAAEELAELGSISWYTTTVKLELEVRGEIRRVPGSSPQRLVRT